MSLTQPAGIAQRPFRYHSYSGRGGGGGGGHSYIGKMFSLMQYGFSQLTR